MACMLLNKVLLTQVDFGTKYNSFKLKESLKCGFFSCLESITQKKLFFIPFLSATFQVLERHSIE